MQRIAKRQISKARRRRLHVQRRDMDEYEHGWKLFFSGSALCECKNRAQQDGWYAAMRDMANAECSTEFRN